jgi:uncharacterized membrane protein
VVSDGEAAAAANVAKRDVAPDGRKDGKEHAWQHTSSGSFLVIGFFCLRNYGFASFNVGVVFFRSVFISSMIHLQSIQCTCLTMPSNQTCTFLQVKIYVHLDLFQVKKID